MSFPNSWLCSDLAETENNFSSVRTIKFMVIITISHYSFTPQSYEATCSTSWASFPGVTVTAPSLIFFSLFQLWDPPAFPSAHPESLRLGEQQAAAAEPPQNRTASISDSSNDFGKSAQMRRRRKRRMRRYYGGWVESGGGCGPSRCRKRASWCLLNRAAKLKAKSGGDLVELACHSR